MRTLPAGRQEAILRCLVEGNSIRATCRMTGAAKGTVLSLLKVVGAHCKNYHDRFVTDVEAKRVQCDEIWSFVGAKQKQVHPNERGKGRGDVWTWTALDQDSKLIVSYKVGNRDPQTAHAFVGDLHGRLATRVQLTTDGLHMYLTAIEETFGWARVDYAMLVKLYGAPQEKEAARRYSPAECMGTEKRPIMGKPKEEDICTSHVERQNLTMRMQMRRSPA